MTRWRLGVPEASPNCGVATFNDDVFDLTGSRAAERGGLLVVDRLEAGNGLLQTWKLDHHEAVEFFWPFHDSVLAAASENLSAELRNDRGYTVGVFLVRDGLDDSGTSYPLG